MIRRPPRSTRTDTLFPYTTLFRSGFVVPVLIGLLTMTIVFSFERYFVISKASGSGNVDQFVTRIQGFLATGNIDSAIAECDKQKGSVANVIRSRSEERRVGKECVSTCRSRWSPYH